MLHTINFINLLAQIIISLANEQKHQKHRQNKSSFAKYGCEHCEVWLILEIESWDKQKRNQPKPEPNKFLPLCTK